MSETPSLPARRPELDGWPKALVDFGPLALFFAANSWGGRARPWLEGVAPGLLFTGGSDSNLIFATAVFMVAMAAALAFSWARTRHVPAMLWFTAALVGVFGGLTIWLHDETFIKIKPTIIFALFSAILWFGLWRGRNYLKLLLGKVFDGLRDTGWTILARRWAAFFLCMAIANELLWRNFETSIWVHWKVWGDTVVTMAFALAQTPMLLKHGLSLEK